jgi:hypothetical protein
LDLKQADALLEEQYREMQQTTVRIQNLRESVQQAEETAAQTQADLAVCANEQQHNEAVRGLSVSRSFADTKAAKSMFEKLRKNQQEANKNVENRNEVLGGTAEAEIAAKGKIQDSTNEAVADMTGQATQWQDMKDRQYENRRDDLYRDKMAQREKKIDSALNLHENASNLLNAAGFMNAMNTAPKTDLRQPGKALSVKKPGIVTNPMVAATSVVNPVMKDDKGYTSIIKK